MSMRNVFSKITLCEVLRDINDILNEESGLWDIEPTEITFIISGY